MLPVHLSVCLSINFVGIRRAMNCSFWLLTKTVLKRCVVTVQMAVGTREVEAYEWENVYSYIKIIRLFEVIWKLRILPMCPIKTSVVCMSSKAHRNSSLIPFMLSSVLTCPYAFSSNVRRIVKRMMNLAVRKYHHFISLYTFNCKIWWWNRFGQGSDLCASVTTL